MTSGLQSVVNRVESRAHEWRTITAYAYKERVGAHLPLTVTQTPTRHQIILPITHNQLPITHYLYPYVLSLELEYHPQRTGTAPHPIV